MKYIKTYEEVNKIEFVAPVVENPSYKTEEKKKKKKRLGGNLEPVMVPPNHTKDIISFKRSG